MNTWNSVIYDAIVIGSGPGGATVAKELSQQGKKILILEWGSSEAVKGTIWQSMKMALIPGRGLYFTPELLALVRFITLGGSSIGAYATAYEPNYEIFDKHGIDLRSDVKQARRELPIAPLKDTLVGPSAKRIMESARQLGYTWEKLPKMVDQDKCRTDCDKCTMGCPYGAKWTSRQFIDQACRNGATLLSSARVYRLVGEQEHITGVQFSIAGSSYTVSAPLVILSAGGIGTPLILRASGIRQAGLDFFFDPLVVVAGTLDDLDDGREFPMSAGYNDQAAGFIVTDLIWPNWVRMIFTLRAGRLDRMVGHRRMVAAMVKIKDDLSGSLSRLGWTNKKLTDHDRARLKKGVKVAQQIIQHTGARNIYTTGVAATHPGGTAKIGDVVDTNLKTRYDNLYVCDCSVIPESWGLPPTLTLIALGKRLANYLATKHGR